MKIKHTFLILVMTFGISLSNAQITWTTPSFKVMCADTNVSCPTNNVTVLTCTITNLLCCNVYCKQMIDSVIYEPSGCYLTICNPNGCFPSTTKSDVITIGAYATIVAKYEIHTSSGTGMGDVRVRFENDWDANEGFNFHIINNVATGIMENSKFNNAFTQNYPNPFSNSTTVKYSLDNPNGKLVITDVQGKFVAEYKLNNNSGEVIVTENFRPGIYFYSLYSSDKMITRNKMIVQ